MLMKLAIRHTQQAAQAPDPAGAPVLDIRAVRARISRSSVSSSTRRQGELTSINAI
jgi:hypothetical protein